MFSFKFWGKLVRCFRNTKNSINLINLPLYNVLRTIVPHFGTVKEFIFPKLSLEEKLLRLQHFLTV